jgi:SAM-dependent methyltransferase
MTAANTPPDGDPSEKDGVKTLTYRPQIFDVPDMDAAKRIILTPEFDVATDTRWERETPYLVERIGQALGLNPRSLVLDYGCGIGRVAKGLIERFGCSVLGVDTSIPMRQLAPGYARSPRFSVCAPELLDHMVRAGLRVDGAISIWVLQHCVRPADDLGRIVAAMRPGAALFVLNDKGRAVPTNEGWANDGIDIAGLIDSALDTVSTEAPDPAGVGAKQSEVTFEKLARKPGGDPEPASGAK